MEIITYGNTELLQHLFIALKFFFDGATDQGKDYHRMILTVGGLGFIMALLAYAFQPTKLAGWYWLGTVVCVSAALVIPRTNVQIVDRLQNCAGGNCVLEVQDVPYALALLASTTSMIGDKLTENFETSFQQVAYHDVVNKNMGFFADTGYRGNGMMFGNKLLRTTLRITFPDPNFQYNLHQYNDKCARPDMSDGTLKVSDLQLSTDLWKQVLMNGGNPARYAPTIESGKDDHKIAAGVLSCDQLRDMLDKAIDIDQVPAARQALAARISSNSNGADGKSLGSAESAAKVDNQIFQTFARSQLQGNTAEDASQAIRQAAMINALTASKTVTHQRLNDPSSMMMGMSMAQAKASTNTAWITSAKIAEEAMPMIRNGIEAVLYAVFPIMVLMCLVMRGAACVKLIGSYVMALAWIQLWPPLYAVLNFMASAASARHLTAAGRMHNGSHGLSLLTSTSLYENAISDEAVVGYMVISIPVIAWAIIKSMETIAGGALAGAAAFSAGSSVGAGEAANGAGIALGQSKAEDIRLAPNYVSANFRTLENASTRVTDDMSSSNLDTATIKQSTGGFDAGWVSQQASSLATAATETASFSDRASRKASETLTAGLTEASQLISQNSRDSASVGAGAHTKVDTKAYGTQKKDGLVDGAGDGHTGTTSAGSGVSNVVSAGTNETTNSALAAGVSAALNKGLGPVKGGLNGSATVTQTFGRGSSEVGSLKEEKAMTDQDLLNKIRGVMTMNTTMDQLSAVESIMTSSGFRSAVANGDSAAISLAQSFLAAKSYQEDSQKLMDHSHSQAATAQFMASNSSRVAQSYNNAIAQGIMKSEGGIDKFAEQLMNSPDEAYNRVSGMAAHLDERMEAQGSASLQARPHEHLHPSLSDGELASIEARYAAGGLDDKDVRATAAANQERLAHETAGRHLNPNPVHSTGKGNPLRFDNGDTQEEFENHQLRDERAGIFDEQGRRLAHIDKGLKLSKNHAPKTVNATGHDPGIPDAPGAAADVVDAVTPPPTTKHTSHRQQRSSSKRNTGLIRWEM